MALRVEGDDERAQALICAHCGNREFTLSFVNLPSVEFGKAIKTMFALCTRCKRANPIADYLPGD